jgi:hypothetical protein
VTGEELVFWITDGHTDRPHLAANPIPEGWTRGRSLAVSFAGQAELSSGPKRGRGRPSGTTSYFEADVNLLSELMQRMGKHKLSAFAAALSLEREGRIAGRKEGYGNRARRLVKVYQEIK